MTRGNPSILIEGDPELEHTLRRKGKEPVHEQPNPADLEVEGYENMAEQNEQQRILSDYARPSVLGTQSSIVRPPITAQNFMLKPAFIHMLMQSAHFNSLADEDPNSHMRTFSRCVI